jgi:hypothetical protein
VRTLALSLRFSLSLEQELKQDALEQRDKREMAMLHEVPLSLLVYQGEPLNVSKSDWHKTLNSNRRKPGI